MDLVLNNLQRLICHKTKPNQTKHLTQIPKFEPQISKKKKLKKGIVHNMC